MDSRQRERLQSLGRQRGGLAQFRAARHGSRRGRTAGFICRQGRAGLSASGRRLVSAGPVGQLAENAFDSRPAAASGAAARLANVWPVPPAGVPEPRPVAGNPENGGASADAGSVCPVKTFGRIRTPLTATAFERLDGSANGAVQPFCFLRRSVFQPISWALSLRREQAVAANRS